MLFRGTHLTDASGSLAGVTYSRNRGGAYTRSRGIPVNSNTQEQQRIRSIFANVQSAWTTQLTKSQREAWDAYASATPVSNSIGAQVNAGGKGMFTRGNVPRIQSGLEIVLPGPATSGLPSLTLPTVASVTAATGIASIGFNPDDEWANDPDGALLVFASRGISPAVNYFKGPYQLAGSIKGSATPITSPKPVTLPFPVVVGQQVFFRFVAVTADGRLSGDARLNAFPV